MTKHRTDSGSAHHSTGASNSGNTPPTIRTDGPRIQKVFEGRAEQSGKPVEEIREEAMAVQSVKRMVDLRDIAALTVFLASDAAKSTSGQMLPIDNDMQQAS